MSDGTVLLRPALLEPFLRASAEEYELSTPAAPPRCWAILVGAAVDGATRIERVLLVGTRTSSIALRCSPTPVSFASET